MMEARKRDWREDRRYRSRRMGRKASRVSPNKREATMFNNGSAKVTAQSRMQTMPMDGGARPIERQQKGKGVVAKQHSISFH